MAPTLDELRNMDDEQLASVLSSLDVADLQAVADSIGSTQQAEEKQKKPLDRSVYNDILALKGLPIVGDAVRGVEALTSPEVSDTMRAVTGGIGATFDPRARMMGNPPPEGSDLSGLRSSSYGDLLRNTAQAVGEGVGSRSGPIGALAGGTFGNIIGGAAETGLNNLIGGPGTDEMTPESFGADALEGAGASVLGRLAPGGEPRLPKALDDIPALKMKMEGMRVDSAFDDIVKVFNPSADEARNSLKIPGQQAQSLRSSIRELSEKYGMDFSSPEAIEGEIKASLGYKAETGNIVDGVLPFQIETAAKALDAQEPVPLRFNDTIPVGETQQPASFFDYVKQAVKSEVKTYDKVREGEQIEREGMERLREIKDSLVPIETKEAFNDKKAELSAVTSRVNSLRNELSTLESRAGKGNKNKQRKLGEKSARIKMDLLKAETEQGNLLTAVNDLQKEIDNPKLSFYNNWEVRVQLDRLAKDAFDNPDASIYGKLYEAMSNAARDFENSRASMINPEVATSLDALQRKYYLLNQIIPGAGRVAKKSFADEEKTGILGRTRGMIRLGRTGVYPVISENLFRGADKKAMRETLSRAQNTINFNGMGNGIGNRNITNLATAAISDASRYAVRGMVTGQVAREARDYVKNSGSLKGLENSITMEALFDAGLVNEEEKRTGVDLNRIQMSNPELFRQVMAEASMPMTMLRDAIRFGDEEDVGVALTQIAKTYPSVFPDPETGIKGEVKVGGKIKLYDAMDRAKYAEKIKQDSGKSWEDKARIVSELNDTWTVVP